MLSRAALCKRHRFLSAIEEGHQMSFSLRKIPAIAPSDCKIASDCECLVQSAPHPPEINLP